MTKIIFEGEVKPENVDIEDGGCAVIVEPQYKVTGGDNNIFVRVQSWDEEIYNHPQYDKTDTREEKIQYGHKSIRQLMDKKIRVTIEVIDDE